jgi:hypothetical protein
MNEPIKAGDACIVIGGLGRGKSPNIGKRVVVKTIMGEHSQHGRIARCRGDGVVQLGDAGNYVETGWADFAVVWLKKADPLPPKVTSTTDELEHT